VRAGDPDVEDGVRPLLRERASRRDRRLDRADPADERAGALDRSELALGRRDDEQH
jgi:hypothetical protein